MRTTTHNSFEAMIDLIDSIQMVHDIFDDNEKVARWFITKNPHLGMAIPIEFFMNGRGHKVLKFIKGAMDENFA